MNKILPLFLILVACDPGQAKNKNEAVISEWEWEPGDTEPRIASGEVWCENDSAGFYIFFLEVNANDPQGANDLDDGVWKTFAEGSSEPIVEDVLYCDGQECIYSFTADQYPEVPCPLIQDFTFVAEIFDYSGNSTGEFTLTVQPPPE